jgi:hypothetical protein
MLHIYEVLLRSKCVDCGRADLLVLEFDHVGKKRGNVVNLARNGCAFETLRGEIAECEVCCATVIAFGRGPPGGSVGAGPKLGVPP